MAEKCAGHDKHMCELTKKKDFDSIGKLAKGAQYVCTACGRAAAKAKNLCVPQKV